MACLLSEGSSSILTRQKVLSSLLPLCPFIQDQKPFHCCPLCILGHSTPFFTGANVVLWLEQLFLLCIFPSMFTAKHVFTETSFCWVRQVKHSLIDTSNKTDVGGVSYPKCWQLYILFWRVFHLSLVQ